MLSEMSASAQTLVHLVLCVYVLVISVVSLLAASKERATVQSRVLLPLRVRPLICAYHFYWHIKKKLAYIYGSMNNEAEVENASCRTGTLQPICVNALMRDTQAHAHGHAHAHAFIHAHT
jgi:hypothetical protein